MHSIGLLNLNYFLITETSSNVHLSFTADGTIVDTPLPQGGVLGDSLQTPVDPPLGVSLHPVPASPDLVTDPLNPIPDTLENSDPINNLKEIDAVREVYKEMKFFIDTPVENKKKTPQGIIEEFIVAIAYELNLKGMMNIYKYVYIYIHLIC
jgi:hypothetical protein